MNEQTKTQTAGRDSAPTFSTGEWSALRALRAHYRQHRDLFSTRELAHLHFQRWLYYAGKVVT